MSRNRLDRETSPYLLQHRDNPVHWQPWDDDAFDQAQRENKPILLSVGYSACHWCHVMAHESFENADIAALMNELFVNIKVAHEPAWRLRSRQARSPLRTPGTGPARG